MTGEAPIRIGNRDELVFLLSEAAELEHGPVMENVADQLIGVADRLGPHVFRV